MKGAIAAGHPLTAEVGARVLERGGNAVDACVAAGFASWATESPLTGPGGAGFMLVHTARDRRTRVLDFFATVPSGPREDPTDITIVFEGSQTQRFRVGTGTCAVPGSTAGLEAAHRAYGSLPWADLVRPAVELARDGFEVTESQAYLHSILAPVLADTPAAGLTTGARLAWPELASTLERIAKRGAAIVYSGPVARAVARTVPAIRLGDLERYRVVRRRPVSTPYRGGEFVSNPPPSSGGVLIAFGLRRLERPGRFGTPAAVARLVRVMNDQTRARENGITRRLVTAGTTHISVVDVAGNAASLSVSTGGGGSSVVVPDTGIHMNNMLGEFDLMVGAPRPGERLTSMMAPSLVLENGQPRLVLGSAGSNRLRGAIMQVAVNVLAHRMDVATAIAAPRVHLEAGVLHLEPPLEPGRVPYEPAHWRARNLFFGGVAAVERLPDGTLAAAGDPRRGGAGLVVG
jgi:gamma-glutamyltranspeptidase / glutathione hydrolase